MTKAFVLIGWLCGDILEVLGAYSTKSRAEREAREYRSRQGKYYGAMFVYEMEINAVAQPIQDEQVEPE